MTTNEWSTFTCQLTLELEVENQGELFLAALSTCFTEELSSAAMTFKAVHGAQDSLEVLLWSLIQAGDLIPGTRTISCDGTVNRLHVSPHSDESQ